MAICSTVLIPALLHYIYSGLLAVHVQFQMSAPSSYYHDTPALVLYKVRKQRLSGMSSRCQNPRSASGKGRVCRWSYATHRNHHRSVTLETTKQTSPHINTTTFYKRRRT